MGKVVKEPMSYVSALERFARERTVRGDPGLAKIAGNTWLVRYYAVGEHRFTETPPGFESRGIGGVEMAVRYHETDIITWYRDGVTKLNPDGWFSATCLERLKRYLFIDVFQRGGYWYADSARVWNRGTIRKGAWNGGPTRWADRRPFYAMSHLNLSLGVDEKMALRARVATSAVKDLAVSIWEEDAWDRLPILADALEETGVESSAWDNFRKYTDGPNSAFAWLLDVLGWKADFAWKEATLV
jgi:hypothetical protein